MAYAETRPSPIFAVVVGVNRPISRDTQRLLHADDDAIMFHRLLATAGYSRLLVEPDNASLSVHGPLPEARLPTRANLLQALEQQFDAVRRAKRRGLRPQFLFIYSGHGNVRRRQGFLALTDGRLTSDDLARYVLSRSPAVATHVVIDACHSHFLVHGVPAGRRGRSLRRSLARRFPGVGFVLSTSSAQSSHEWNELEAGVFSHEVRSGLHGAADVNGDGRVGYDEIWAFMQAANARVPGARFRPRVYVRPPRGAASSTLLDLRGFPGATLSVNNGGRYVLEDDSGARLADFHAAPGVVVTLRLPLNPRVGGGLFLHDLHRLMEYPIPDTGIGSDHFDLAGLPGRASRYRVKGQARTAYSHLFDLAFGPEAYAALMTCRPSSRQSFPCRYSASSEPEPAPQGRAPVRVRVRHRPSWQHIFSVALGLRTMSHRLDISGPVFPDSWSRHANLRSDWHAALELSGTLYPLAGPLANLGVEASYYHSIGMSAQPSDTPEEMDATTQELRIGPRYRWNILNRATSPVLRAGIDAGFHQFQLDTSGSQFPHLRYLFVRLALLDLHVPLVTRGDPSGLPSARRYGLGLNLAFSYRAVLSAGAIEATEGSGYGGASTGGIEASGGLLVWFGRVALSLNGFYQRYAIDFAMSCNHCTRQAAGAVDLYYGINLGVAYRY